MSDGPVELERVHGRVRRAIPAPASLGGVAASATTVEDGDDVRPPLTIGDAVPVATVGLVGLATGELAVSVLAGVAALGALALRRLAIRERFGFGDGFTPFRSDLGWPQGVQEDDDFHWSWTGPRDEAASGGGRSLGR
jgi:hypothetical protein